MTFLEKISGAIEAFPERNAFFIEGNPFTYAFLKEKIQSIKHEINRYPEHKVIGIIISDSIDTYAAILAVMLSGKTYVPVNPSHPTAKTEYMIGQSGIKLLFTGTSFSYPDVTVIDTTALPILLGTETTPVAQPERTDTAYILFTSGTTGVPKGVPLSFGNLDSFVEAFFALGYKVSETDRFLQMFDLTFDLSIMSYIIPLCIGACVYTVSDNGMKYTNVFEVLESHDISFALMVPSILSYLRPYFSEINLPAMRYCLFCGEALYNDTVRDWLGCVPNAVVENVYGPTEATIFCLTYHITSREQILNYNEIVSIGKPMKSTKTVVIDDRLALVAHGSKGELCLGGDQVTTGYLDPARSKDAFVLINGDRYYRSGDIVFELEDGNYMYCGRADHQVKIQGYRVELSEIEFHLRKIADNPNVVVLATDPGGKGLMQLEAVFESGSEDFEGIIHQLRSRLPAYMIPVRTHHISPFPLNNNGKTDRNALKKIILELNEK